MTKIEVASSYKTPPSKNDDPATDWAVLTLDRDISSITRSLEITKLREDDLANYRATGARFIQAGYSQDKAHILTVHDGCALLDLGGDSRMLFHDCDATRGDSGSPIMVLTGDTYRILGIHVATANFAGRGVGVSAAAYQARDLIDR